MRRSEIRICRVKRNWNDFLASKPAVEKVSGRSEPNFGLVYFVIYLHATFDRRLLKNIIILIRLSTRAVSGPAHRA